jgi:hypothetical protein
VGYLCMEVCLEKGGRIESKFMLLEFQESEGEGRAKEGPRRPQHWTQGDHTIDVRFSFFFNIDQCYFPLLCLSI